MSDLVAKLGDLVPSIYYDLIARVASGLTVVALLVAHHSGSSSSCELIAWLRHPVTMVFAGYLVGLGLTPLGMLVGLVDLLAWKAHARVTSEKSWAIRDVAKKYDRIDKANPRAGATLAKMHAEATLCANLAAAYFGFLALAPEVLPFARSGFSGDGLGLGALLLASAWWRGVAYYERQDRLLELYGTDR